MLERLKTSNAMANLDSKSEIENQISNFKIKSQIQNSNLVLQNEIALQNEVLDLRDLTDRYWRVIQAQHVRIARLESELCARTAPR
jgi:hypothetical protein